MSLTAILAKAFAVPILGAIGKRIARILTAGMDARGIDFWTGIMESRRMIHQCIDEIRASADARRVVVLQAHNGNAPRFGCQLKSSVIFESFDNQATPIMQAWQNELIDDEYAAILTKVLERGYIIIKRSEMPKRSTLRKVYEAHGIEKSHVFLIAQEPDRLVYASVNFATESDIGALRVEAIRGGCTRLRQLFTDPKRGWRF